MTTRRADVQVRWILDLVDKATRPMLSADKSVRSSLEATDKAYTKTAATATKAMDRQTRAAVEAGDAAKKAALAQSRAAISVERAQDRAQGATKRYGKESLQARTATLKLAEAENKLAIAARRAGDASSAAARKEEAAASRADAAARRRSRSTGALRGAAGLTNRGVRGGVGVASRGVGALGIGASLGAGAFLSDAVSEYQEARKVGAQANAVLKSTGSEANVTARHVTRLSSTLAKQAAVDNELVGQGENLLLTFRNVRNEQGKGNKIFDRTTRLATDMSASFKAAGKSMEISDASLLLGKALNDPAKGYTRLMRSGVSFTEQQGDQIKALEKSGHTLDAQKVILREVAKEFAGSAKATATPLDRLKASYLNLAEAAGQAAAPAIDKGAKSVGHFLNQMASGRGAGGSFVRTLGEIWQGAKHIGSEIKPVVGDVAHFVGEHPGLVKVAGAMVAVAAGVRAIKFAGQITGVNTLLGLLKRVPAQAGAADAAMAGAGIGTAGGAGRLARAGSGLRGAAARVPGALGIAGAGVAISQATGAAIGGSAGAAVGSIGTGAAAGAAAGSVIPGVGTAVGAVGGAVIGGLVHFIGAHKAAVQSEMLDVLALKGRNVHLNLGAVTVSKQDADKYTAALSRARNLAADKHTATVGRGAGVTGTFAPSGADMTAAAKKYAEAGRVAVAAFESAVTSGPRYQTAGNLLRGFNAELKNIPPQFRGAAAESMAQFAQTLAADGRLPQNELKALMRRLGNTYDISVDGAKRAGKLADKALSDALRAGKSRERAQELLHDLGQTFGGLPRNVDLNATNAQKVLSAALQTLRHTIRTTHGQEQDDARAAYKQLLDITRTYTGQARTAAASNSRLLAADVLRNLRHLNTESAGLFAQIRSNASAASRAAAVPSAPPGRPDLVRPHHRRRGGLNFNGGGMVPIMAAGGEMLVHRGRGMMIPGDPRSDSTFLMAPAGSAVITGHGQALMGAGASLSEALQAQLPHFAAGGLVKDAFAQGYSRAQGEGGGIRGALKEALIGEPHRKKSTALTGGRGSVPANAPATVAAMVSRADAIAARHLPYTYGGGHSGFGVGTPGFDCSGYVSAILGPGTIPAPAAVVSPMNSYLAPGVGKYVTVGMRGSSGQDAHTMIRLGSNYYESGGTHGPARVGGWDGGFSMYHPRGLRRGGRVGNYRKGGNVPRAGQVQHAAKTVTGHRGKDFVQYLDRFANALDSAALGRVETLRGQVVKLAKHTDGKALKRLRGAVSVIDFALGERAGQFVAAATRATGRADHATAATDRRIRRRGIDPSGVHGLALTALTEAGNQHVLEENRARLTAARAIARKAGSRGTVRELTSQLSDLRESIAESATKQIELYRQAVQAKSQARVDTATFRADVGSAMLSRLDANQRVAGTTDTAAGMRDRANAITGGLVPLLQKQAGAYLAQSQTLAKTGDTAGSRSAYLSWLSTITDMTNAMADAGDLIKQAAETQAQALVDSATHGSNLANSGLTHLELEQRLSGTFDQGGKARADYINNNIRPALQKELDALTAQQATAKAQGDQALADQIAEAIAGKQNDLLQASVDALEQVAQNTAPRRVGGTLGFASGGETLTDLLVLSGNGA